MDARAGTQGMAYSKIHSGMLFTDMLSASLSAIFIIAHAHLPSDFTAPQWTGPYYIN